MSRFWRNLYAGLAAGSLAVGVACAPRAGQPYPTPTAKSDSESGDAAPKDVPNDATPIVAPPEDVKALAEGNNAFAIDLYKQLAAKTDGNLFFSPYSVRTALAMTYAGARGQTAEEMAKALHFTLPPEKLHPAFGATAYQLQERGKKPPEPEGSLTPAQKLFAAKNDPFQLTVANALWGQRGFALQPEFFTLTKRNYGGGFRELDFAGDTEGSRKAINRWVEEQTKDKIKEILKSSDLSSGCRLVLTNAIYFKAIWATPFHEGETRDAPFEVAPDEKVTVAMMQTESSFGYSRTDNCEALELPYEDKYKTDRISMIILLPRKGQFATFEKSLTASTFRQAVGNLSVHHGKVCIPKFQVRTSAHLKDKLAHLGMPLAFSDWADFSGIMSNGRLSIDDVIHQAYVNVEERGTEAAAATAVSTYASDPPPFAFAADRPFLFFIRDNQTRNILFYGRVVRPGKAT